MNASKDELLFQNSDQKYDNVFPIDINNRGTNDDDKGLNYNGDRKMIYDHNAKSQSERITNINVLSFLNEL